eukprot:3911651-Prymnesium_polylepis.3
MRVDTARVVCAHVPAHTREQDGTAEARRRHRRPAGRAPRGCGSSPRGCRATAARGGTSPPPLNSDPPASVRSPGCTARPGLPETSAPRIRCKRAPRRASPSTACPSWSRPPTPAVVPSASPPGTPAAPQPWHRAREARARARSAATACGSGAESAWALTPLVPVDMKERMSTCRRDGLTHTTPTMADGRCCRQR